MRVIIRRFVGVPGSVLFLISLLSAGPGFSVGGYFKNFFVVIELPGFSLPGNAPLPDRLMGSVNNRLRLHASADISPSLRVSVAYDLSPRIQDPFLFGEHIFAWEVDPYGYRAADLKERLYPQEKAGLDRFAIYQNLDRLVLFIATEPADISIGRQAIAWGSARAVNPIDIIAPFALQELDKEERVGVDAVRLRFPLGFMGEIDAGYVFGKDFRFEKSAFFLRAKTYAAKTDLSFLFLVFRENLLLGGDITRSIGGAGFWMEGAYVLADIFRGREFDGTNDYLRLSTGLDYSLSGNTYGFVEYHYNSGGSTHPENYLPNLSNSALQEGSVFLLGRHYIIPGLNHQITPLIGLMAQVLINLSDGSFFVAPAVEYNLASNVYIAAGGFLGSGKIPSPVRNIPQAPGGGLRSEFGSYSDAFYTSFRIYF